MRGDVAPAEDGCLRHTALEQIVHFREDKGWKRQ